jgi:hypothetical protein
MQRFCQLEIMHKKHMDYFICNGSATAQSNFAWHHENLGDAIAVARKAEIMYASLCDKTRGS